MRAGYFATDAAELNNLATCQIVSIVFILMGLSADKTLHAMEYMKNKELISHTNTNRDVVTQPWWKPRLQTEGVITPHLRSASQEPGSDTATWQQHPPLHPAS